MRDVVKAGVRNNSHMISEEKHGIKTVIFLIIGLFLLMIACYKTPQLYGDWHEYLNMTVSLANHFSPEISTKDLFTVDKILNGSEMEWNNDGQSLENLEVPGYYQALNGKYYSYHFWFYSLLNVLAYELLKVMSMNPLKVFQLTNALLSLIAIGWLFFRSKLDNRSKSWLFFTFIFGPVWFYLPWSHPEVFSFVFLFIGLLELLDNREKSACLLTAVSSLQNPAIAVVTAGIVLRRLFRDRKITLGLLKLILVSSTVLIPYIFFWINYHKFSLIAAYATSPSAISFNKILSLFIDPNFGLLFYVPVLLFVFIILIFKRNQETWYWGIILLLIAVIDATQLNWNCGMMYIHRYALLMIPILMVTTLQAVQYLATKKFIHITLLYILITGLVTSAGLAEYRPDNYLRFMPMAKIILAVTPSLYNPPVEVFAERVLYEETIPKNTLVLVNSQGIRKGLIYDENTGQMHYINGPLSFTSDFNLMTLKNFSTLQNFSAGQDIFKQSILAGFTDTWYPLEHTTPPRRAAKQWADLAVQWDQGQKVRFAIRVLGINSIRPCSFRLNGRIVSDAELLPGEQTLEFEGRVKKGLNFISLSSEEGPVIPKEIPELNNPDRRAIAFYVYSISIEPVDK